MSIRRVRHRLQLAENQIRHGERVPAMLRHLEERRSKRAALGERGC